MLSPLSCEFSIRPSLSRGWWSALTGLVPIAGRLLERVDRTQCWPRPHPRRLAIWVTTD